MKNHQTTKPPNRQADSPGPLLPDSPGPSLAGSLRTGVGRRGGFTLIEAALTTVIVGTGVLAIVAAQQAYHQKNDWAQRTGTAMRLANEVRELTLPLPAHDPITGGTLGPEANEIQPQDADGFDTPVVQLADDQRLDYDDLDDFAGMINAGKGSGLTFSPPISALRGPLTDMGRWAQTIEVEKVPEDEIDREIVDALDSDDSAALRVSVTVTYRENGHAPEAVTSLRWVVMGQ